MTVSQLSHLAHRHGFELAVDEAGPKLKKVRADAVLPGKVRFTFQTHRQVILDWFRRQDRPEWETCRVCLAQVHATLTPDDAGFLCEARRCPYQEH